MSTIFPNPQCVISLWPSDAIRRHGSCRFDIGSANGLPIRRQAIIWSNADLLPFGPSGRSFREILIKTPLFSNKHYNDIIRGTMVTSLTIVYSTVYSGADQRKHQSSASLAFVRGIHRGPVNSPHKWSVMRKMFPFDDVIMNAMKHRLQCGIHFVSASTC